MPWWWMRPPSAAQELGLGMSHWVMSHKYQLFLLQPGSPAQLNDPYPIISTCDFFRCWSLQMSIEDVNSYWCVDIQKRPHTTRGESSTWRHHPSPSGGETCFPTLGWSIWWLDMAGQGWAEKNHRHPLRRSECLHDGASWLACFHHFYPFLASIVAAISGSNLALSRGIRPEHYLTDVELFFVCCNLNALNIPSWS